MNENLHLWLIPLLPFAGFLLNGLLGSRLPKPLVTAIALLAPLGSLLVVLGAFAFSFQPTSCPTLKPHGQWINAGSLHIDFSFVLDQLSLVMLLVVTGVGFLIHIYSVGYMHEDEGYCALFLVHEPVHVLHDGSRTRRKRSVAVCRLGGRWPRLVSPYRLLVSEELCRRRRARKHSSLTASATSAFSSGCFCCWPTSARLPSAKSRRS